MIDSGNIWITPRSHVKTLNKHVILDLIRFTVGGITRADISRQLGLTRAAVSGIIKDLVDEGIVREGETKFSGGRRPVTLEIVPEKGFVIGVDIGATHLYVCLSDFGAKIIHEGEVNIDINDGPEIVLTQVEQLIQQILREKSLDLKEISAIGVGVPGPVIFEKGTVSMPPIMPGWNNFPIRDYLSKKLGKPVLVNNDAELGALGEWAYGAGRGEKNITYIKVGTGIGAGLIFENKIYHGTAGAAGEIGHTTIDEKGPQCTCGNFGCLEALAGGYAITQKASSALESGKRSLLKEKMNSHKITAKDVIATAKMGDLLSQQIISDAGKYLGIAIAGLINVINPAIVIIGGGVSASGDLLLDPIREAVSNRSLFASFSTVRISAALLGKRATGMGAITQALSYIIHKTDNWDRL